MSAADLLLNFLVVQQCKTDGIRKSSHSMAHLKMWTAVWKARHLVANLLSIPMMCFSAVKCQRVICQWISEANRSLASVGKPQEKPLVSEQSNSHQQLAPFCCKFSQDSEYVICLTWMWLADLLLHFYWCVFCGCCAKTGCRMWKACKKRD